MTEAVLAAVMVAAAAAVGASVGQLVGRRQRGHRSRGPWSRPLLLLESEDQEVPAAAVEVACRLVPGDGVLDVLAAVRLPLAVPMEAPPGEETVALAALAERVERLAGWRGVRARTHLRRGRSVRQMLRAALAELGSDVVVLHGGPERLALLDGEQGVQVVLVTRGGEGHGGPPAAAVREA